MLEFWLVILNLLDFLKDFLLGEFRKELVAYHDEGYQLKDHLQFLDVRYVGNFWERLEHFLTHDLRDVQISVLGTASEFEFYCFAMDRKDLIFFSMDIRDLGVDLLMWYEDSNEEIKNKPNSYEGIKLMEETFRASDPINAQRRFTYDQVVKIFEKYQNKIWDLRKIHSHTVQKPVYQRWPDLQRPDPEELVAKERYATWKNVHSETIKAFGHSGLEFGL